MAKRFPIPEFEYEQLKGRSWTPPQPIDGTELERVLSAARAGDASVCGAYPVAADDAMFDALNVRGQWRNAVLCVLPHDGATMTGRSHAWKRQWLAAIDGAPAAAPAALLEWKTPRPMNTRLGPQDGVAAPGSVLTLVSGHLFADHRVGNRSIADNAWQPQSGSGFRVLFCDDEDLNDFHAAVVTFTWGA